MKIVRRSEQRFYDDATLHHEQLLAAHQASLDHVREANRLATEQHERESAESVKRWEEEKETAQRVYDEGVEHARAIHERALSQHAEIVAQHEEFRAQVEHDHEHAVEREEKRHALAVEQYGEIRDAEQERYSRMTAAREQAIEQRKLMIERRKQQGPVARLMAKLRSDTLLPEPPEPLPPAEIPEPEKVVIEMPDLPELPPEPELLGLPEKPKMPPKPTVPKLVLLDEPPEPEFPHEGPPTYTAKRVGEVEDTHEPENENFIEVETTYGRVIATAGSYVVSNDDTGEAVVVAESEFDRLFAEV
jgi:hypothetical protein